MRKLSKTRSSGAERNALESDLLDTRPRGLPGATITSWPGSLDIDFDTLFVRATDGATVTGARPAETGVTVQRAEPTVALSDGTSITFVTTSQFEVKELA